LHTADMTALPLEDDSFEQVTVHVLLLHVRWRCESWGSSNTSCEHHCLRPSSRYRWPLRC
jgi:hypothetical protein